MKNTKASYRYFNELGIFEIWKTIDRIWSFWVVGDLTTTRLPRRFNNKTFALKRECKAFIEKEYGKLKNIQEINFNG